MNIPQAAKDHGMESLAAHVKAVANEEFYKLCDAEGLPRIGVINQAIAVLPSLIPSTAYPLLTCYRTSSNFNTSVKSAIFEWYQPLSTQTVWFQHHYLVWVSDQIMAAIADYPNSGSGCFEVDVSSIRCDLGYVKVNDKGLDFASIQGSFSYT